MADRSVTVRLFANVAQFKAAMRDAEGSTNRTTESLKRQDTQLVKQEKTIDRFSGRLRVVAEAGALLGPAIVPMSAAAVQGLAGVASGFIAIGSAAGIALAALHGVGTGLKALDAYQLEPTAANLEKVRAEFDKLGPAGADFVRYLDGLEPQLKSLQNTARAGFLPGVEDGIDALLQKAPQVQRIIANISTEMGHLTADGGKALASDRFTEFFNYLETDAAPTLRDFTVSLGNVAEGVAHLIVAFAPMSSDFSQGLVDLTDRFAAWSAELSKTDGFREFTAYVQQNGPAVMDFFGSLTMALIDIGTAAAPFGQTLLPILTDLLQLLSSIAGSPIGPTLFTAAAGFLALSRATKILGPGIGSLSDAFLDLRNSPNIARTAVERFGGAAKIAAGAAGMGLFMTSINETNKGLRAFEGAAGGALAGLAVGGPWGAAVGGAIGLIVSLGTAHDDTARKVDELAASYDRQTGAITENTRAQAVQSLQTSGMLDAAEQLGLSTQMVTDAVLGQAGAQAQLNTALQGHDFDATITSVDDLRKSFSEAEVQTILQNRAATTLRDGLPGLASNFKDAHAKAEQFAGAMSGTAGSMAGTGAAAAKSRSQIAGLTKAMEEQRSAALAGFDANTRYGQALAAARKQAATADQGINEMTAAGQRNREALSGLAGAWNNLSPAAQNATGKFHEARSAFIQTATAMGVPIGRARDLANRLMEIPKSKVVQVTAQTNAALADILRLKGTLDAVRSKSITITTNAVTHHSMVEPHANIGKAGGGPIVGPGTKTSDSVPILGSNGEFMMSAAAVDHYGLSTMYAMNAQRLAGGGPVGRKPKGKKKPKPGAWLSGWDMTRPPGFFGSDLYLHPKDTIKDMGLGASVATVLNLGKRIKSLTAGIHESERAIAKETKHRDALSAVVDTNRAELERLQGLYGALSDSIQQGLSQDLFAPVTEKANSNNPWSSFAPNGGTEDVTRAPTYAEIMARIGQDTAGANAFTAATTTVGKYLSGDALQSVIGTGDLGRAQMFAGLSPAQLGAYQAAFGSRASALTTAGNKGGDEVFGEAIAKQTDLLSASVERLDQSNAHLNELNKQLKLHERYLDRTEKIQDKVRDHLQELRREEKQAHADDLAEARKLRGDTNAGLRARR